MIEKDVLPVSATRPPINALALALAICLLVGVMGRGHDTIILLFAFLSAYALPLVLYDTLVLSAWSRESAGLVQWQGIHTTRSFLKFLAFTLTILFLYSVYGLVPLYAEPLFAPFVESLDAAVPLTLALAIPYILIVDAFMKAPEDGLWEVSQLMLGRWSHRNWDQIREYMLAWLIKGFFLPLMFSYLYKVTHLLNSIPLAEHLGDPLKAYFFLVSIALFADLIVATVGYIFTFRVLDTHIRSSNNRLYGWIFTLICYYPFWPILYGNYLSYNDGMIWSDWLSPGSILFWFWLGTIVLLKAIWVYANVSFGLRFSNLTNRGIITNGAFRFTKHPSYIAKNLGWWLIFVPFLSSSGPIEALQNSLLLLAVNVIYFIRARAEECHLSGDPNYVAYANWINKHGIFRRIGQFSASVGGS